MRDRLSCICFRYRRCALVFFMKPGGSSTQEEKMRRKKSKNAVLVGLLGVVVLAVGWVRVVGIYGGSPNAASACHHERLADALTHQVPGLGAACYLGHVESNVRCGFLPRIVARTWDIANNRGGNCHDCWQRTSRSPLLSIAAFVIYSGNLQKAPSIRVCHRNKTALLRKKNAPIATKKSCLALYMRY